jgi:sugar-specific transcriptional regulator TrmB
MPLDISMISKSEIAHVEDTLKDLGLGKYQSRVLAYLYALGKSKAPEISKASGVPRAKIYAVLQELCILRLTRQTGTKPLQFEPIDPQTGLENLKIAKKEQFQKDIKAISDIAASRLDLLYNLYEKSLSTETEEEFLEILTVGTASEIETRKLYQEAQKEINVISRAFEYLPKVKDNLEPQLQRGVFLKVILLNSKYLSEKDLNTQIQMRDMLLKMGADVRISPDKLPIRFTLIDPSFDYDRGAVLFMVEEESIPVFMRFAVLSENHSLAAGFKQYFDLLWKESESQEELK